MNDSKQYFESASRIEGFMAFLIGLTIAFFMGAGPGGIGFGAILILFTFLALLVLTGRTRFDIGSQLGITSILVGNVLLVFGMFLSSFVQADVELQRVFAISTQYLFAFLFVPFFFLYLRTSALRALFVGYVVGGYMLAAFSISLYVFFESFARSQGWIWGNGRLYLWGGPNGIGPHMLMCFFLALLLSNELRPVWKLAMRSSSIIFLITLALTGSNGAIVNFLIATIVFLVTSKKIKIILGSALGLLVFISVMIHLTEIADELGLRAFSRFNWISQQNLESAGTFDGRNSVIKIAWEHISKHPIIGVGAGSASHSGVFYRSDGFSGQPHNAYILIWAEGGAFSILGFLIWILSGLFLLFRGNRKEIRPFGLALFAVMIVAMGMRPHSYQLWLIAPFLLVSVLEIRYRKIGSLYKRAVTEEQVNRVWSRHGTLSTKISSLWP